MVMHDDYFVWIVDDNFNRISSLYDYDCYSEWSYIKDNRILVLSVEEAAVVDASDETLIEELNKRGYDVVKKEETK